MFPAITCVGSLVVFPSESSPSSDGSVTLFELPGVLAVPVTVKLTPPAETPDASNVYVAIYVPVSPAANEPAPDPLEFEKKVGEELRVKADPFIPVRVCEIVKVDKARLLIFFALIVNTTTSVEFTVLSESVTISE